MYEDLLLKMGEKSSDGGQFFTPREVIRAMFHTIYDPCCGTGGFLAVAYDLTHVKVGKKSPMTLGHFGFGKTGEILDDADLPAALTEAWTDDENSADNSSRVRHSCRTLHGGQGHPIGKPFSVSREFPSDG